MLSVGAVVKALHGGCRSSFRAKLQVTSAALVAGQDGLRAPDQRDSFDGTCRHVPQRANDLPALGRGVCRGCSLAGVLGARTALRVGSRYLGIGIAECRCVQPF